MLEVRRSSRGPQILVSRTHKGFLKRLFELEVPEIHSGTVEIKAIAREAGSRSKVAVASRQDGLDPVGATVGQRGARVQAVVAELGGEKIDIIPWNDDAGVFVANALSPGPGDQRRHRRGEADRERDGPGADAVAGDRPRGPERPPRRAPDRLADRHPQRRLGRRGEGRRRGGEGRDAGDRGRRVEATVAKAETNGAEAAAAEPAKAPARAKATTKATAAADTGDATPKRRPSRRRQGPTPPPQAATTRPRRAAEAEGRDREGPTAKATTAKAKAAKADAAAETPAAEPKRSTAAAAPAKKSRARRRRRGRRRGERVVAAHQAAEARRRVPTRSCVACRTARAKRELVRIVRTPDGELKIDETGRLAGRGAYLCRDAACWTTALGARRARAGARDAHAGGPA